MTNVCILGTGIAGLLAAKAAEETGAEVTLYDQNPGNSGRTGLHYLHDPCGLDLSPINVYNIILYDETKNTKPHMQYARKLKIPKENSLMDLQRKVEAYSMQEAYRAIWDRFQDRAEERVIEPRDLKKLIVENDWVISSIPLNCIVSTVACMFLEYKAFRGQPKGLGIGSIDKSYNIVVYNTDENYDWYRYSRIEGVEWTEGLTKGEFTVIKPINVNFKVPYKNLILTGRWGRWQRGVLAHESYYQVKKALGGKA